MWVDDCNDFCKIKIPKKCSCSSVIMQLSELCVQKNSMSKLNCIDKMWIMIYNKIVDIEEKVKTMVPCQYEGVCGNRLLGPPYREAPMVCIPQDAGTALCGRPLLLVWQHLF